MMLFRCDHCKKEMDEEHLNSYFTVAQTRMPNQHFCSLECIATYFWQRWEDHAA